MSSTTTKTINTFTFGDIANEAEILRVGDVITIYNIYSNSPRAFARDYTITEVKGCVDGAGTRSIWFRASKGDKTMRGKVENFACPIMQAWTGRGMAEISKRSTVTRAIESEPASDAPADVEGALDAEVAAIVRQVNRTGALATIRTVKKARGVSRVEASRIVRDATSRFDAALEAEDT